MQNKNKTYSIDSAWPGFEGRVTFSTYVFIHHPLPVNKKKMLTKMNRNPKPRSHNINIKLRAIINRVREVVFYFIGNIQRVMETQNTGWGKNEFHNVNIREALLTDITHTHTRTCELVLTTTSKCGDWRG